MTKVQAILIPTIAALIDATFWQGLDAAIRNSLKQTAEDLFAAQQAGTVTEDLVNDFINAATAAGLQVSLAEIKPEYQATVINSGSGSGSGSVDLQSLMDAVTDDVKINIKETDSRARMLTDDDNNVIYLPAGADKATLQDWLQKAYPQLEVLNATGEFATPWKDLITSGKFKRPVACTAVIVNTQDLRDAEYTANSGINLASIYGTQAANAILAGGPNVKVETRRVTLNVETEGGETIDNVRIVMTTPVKKDENGNWIPMLKDFTRPSMGGIIPLLHYPEAGFYETREGGRDLALQYCHNEGFTVSATTVAKAVTEEELQAMDRAAALNRARKGLRVTGVIPNHTPVVQ
jgi:hypothetical protein